MKEKIQKNGKEYKLVKKYPNYFLFEEVKTGFKECFDYFDLGMIKPLYKVNLKKKPHLDSRKIDLSYHY